MFERYQKLLPELQLRIIEIYFQDAMFTLTNNKAILTDAHPKRHAILFVSHEMRKQAFPVFLSTSTFRIELDYLKQKKRNDHHLYMRHIAIHGCTIRASVDTLRDHFPDLRSLRIYYQPQVKINFGSLPTFVACKSSCCNDGFKRLLLNAISFGDDKSDECWISSLKGLKNRNALMGNSGFEIRLLMRIKTDFEHRGSSKFMTAFISPRDYVLRLLDSDGVSFSMAQKAIDEDERCELVQVLLGGEMARYFSHQWRTPDKTVDAAAAPIAMTPPTIP